VSRNQIGKVCTDFPGIQPAPITANISEHGVILRLPLSWLRVGDLVTIEAPEGGQLAVIGEVSAFDDQGRAVVVR
jgi:hypothetical protein